MPYLQIRLTELSVCLAAYLSAQILSSLSLAGSFTKSARGALRFIAVNRPLLLRAAQPYHSFLCIRGGSQLSDFPAFGDDVSSLGSPLIFSQAFCSAILLSPFRAILGPRTVFGSYLTTNPTSGLHEGLFVLIGQFTLPEDDEFTFQGVVDYTLVDPVNPSGNVLVNNPFLCHPRTGSRTAQF